MKQIHIHHDWADKMMLTHLIHSDTSDPNTVLSTTSSTSAPVRQECPKRVLNELVNVGFYTMRDLILHNQISALVSTIKKLLFSGPRIPSHTQANCRESAWALQYAASDYQRNNAFRSIKLSMIHSSSILFTSSANRFSNMILPIEQSETRTARLCDRVVLAMSQPASWC